MTINTLRYLAMLFAEVLTSCLLGLSQVLLCIERTIYCRP